MRLNKIIKMKNFQFLKKFILMIKKTIEWFLITGHQAYLILI